jgi:hypothetical protein
MSFRKSPRSFFCLVLFIVLAGNGPLAGSSIAAEQAGISCGVPRRSNSTDFQQWHFKNACSRKVILRYIYKDLFGQSTGVAWAEPCKDGQILQVRLDAQIEWTQIEVEANAGGCDARSTGDTLNPTAEQSSNGETAQLKKSAEAATEALEEERKKTAALTDDLASARRDLESKTALSSKAGDETAQLKRSAEAATAALQDERKKTAALMNDLATARRDLESKTARSSKAGDETAQLKKSAEAATAALQEERKKTAALTDDLAAARRD